MRYTLALLGLFLSTELNAAAWTLNKGDGQLIFTANYYQSDRYVDANGDAFSQSMYSKGEDTFYTEYGVRDWLTIGFNPSLQWVQQDISGSNETNFNVADSEWFVRTRLYKDDRNVLSIQPLIKLPGFYDETDRPGLGQGQTDYELRLLYGHNFGKDGRHYINTEAAYRLRSEDPGDEIRLAATLGYQMNERWQVLPEINGTFAVDGAGTGGAFLSNSFDYDLVKLQLSAVYWWRPNVGFQLGGYHSIYSRNTGEGGGAIFGVWYRW